MHSLVYGTPIITHDNFDRQGPEYEAIAPGKPVLVGSNTPMAQIVRHWQCGVVLKSDGRDEEDIREDLSRIVVSKAELAGNVLSCRKNIIWEEQSQEIDQILNTCTNSNSIQ